MNILTETFKDNPYTQKREQEQPTKFIYKTDFVLEYPVNDLESAQEYLTEDPMLQYFDEGELLNKLNSITWILEDVQNGFVEVCSRVELSKEELEEISDFISGQNSDGLGEGFEQQDFAETYEEYEDEDREYFYSSFDWRTNSYKLKLV